uniref:Uncharacterized protein n=1 Tax=Xiphophorus maculatus TaxID=8083 RepID=A0A3B5QEB2_XIPMA
MSDTISSWSFKKFTFDVQCSHTACLKKTTKFPQSLMIWGCMSGKGTGEMTVVNSSINAQVYIDILDKGREDDIRIEGRKDDEESKE